MSSADRWLLPEGIDEILPPQATKLERLRRDLLDLYRSWGYDQVVPPMVEYLESLLTGVGNDLSLQTFKLTDQLTGRTMGIRADMTPQVARMDAHTINRDGPVRLCYAGHVLHTKPASLLDSRSLIQIGVELFGHSGIDADIEVVSLMLHTLAKSGVEQLHLDLGHVAIYRELATAANLSESQEQTLHDIYQRKAVPELEAFVADNVVGAELQRGFLALAQLAGDHSVLDQARQQLGSYPAVTKAIDELALMAAHIKTVFPQVSLYFDLGELRGYHYHTGLVFSAYVSGKGQAIANGGRYDHVGEVFGRARPATGFSADLAVLMKFDQRETANGLVFAPCVSSMAEEQLASLNEKVTVLRSQGLRVVSGLAGQEENPQTLGCTEQLVYKESSWQLESL